MRKIKPFIILFLFVGIFFSAMFINPKTEEIMDKNQNKHFSEPNEEINTITPKKSGTYLESFIHIDGNWSAAEVKDWCYGDGSWGNPYVIENVTIDASSSPTGSGIFINNSKTEYFIIRNCTVYNGGTGTYNAGIKLENTNNGTIYKNNCSKNGQSGILLTQYCVNNTISNNVVDDNGLYGVCLYVDCDDNTIFNNTCSNDMTTSQYIGIFIYLNCDDNKILNNTANGNRDQGIRLLTQCHRNIVANNTINSNGETEAGIKIDYCQNTKLSGNKMENCGIIILGNTHSQTDTCTIYTNNTVNGKPVYYYADENNLNTNNFTYSGAPGQIILANCRDSTISGFNLSYSTVGIELIYSENITVSHNIVDYNRLYGIYLLQNCYNNTIFNNTINKQLLTSYGQDGLYLEWYCSDNNITGNIFNYNGGNGIILSSYSNNNDIINNTVSYNARGGYYGKGILLSSYCDYNNIINNTAKDNKYVGIQLITHCNDNTIENNTACDSGAGITVGYGIWLSNLCEDNTIVDNTANNNKKYGIYLSTDCDDNTIIDNTASNTSAGFSQEHGIYLRDECDDNEITGNTANGHIYSGICIEDESTYNYISDNFAIHNSIGIELLDSDYNEVMDNTNIINNTFGISLKRCNNTIIRGNVANFNDDSGIFLNLSYHNRIYYNTAKNNSFGLHFLDSSYNCYYDNTIVDNTDGDYWESGTCNQNGDCRTLPSGDGGDDDDDDKDDERGIPFSNFYLIFLAVGIVGLYFYQKRKIK